MRLTKMHSLGNDYLYYYGELSNPKNGLVNYQIDILELVQMESLRLHHQP